jgi:hypothetical protein
MALFVGPLTEVYPTAHPASKMSIIAEKRNFLIWPKSLGWELSCYVMLGFDTNGSPVTT